MTFHLNALSCWNECQKPSQYIMRICLLWEIFDGAGARTQTRFMCLAIEKSNMSECLLQQLMCEIYFYLKRETISQHSHVARENLRKWLKLWNSLGKAFLCNIWWRFMKGSIIINEKRHRLWDLHIVAYLRQAWSFVALMMKSSHSGLEFWNEKEAEKFVKIWSRKL